MIDFLPAVLSSDPVHPVIIKPLTAIKQCRGVATIQDATQANIHSKQFAALGTRMQCSDLLCLVVCGKMHGGCIFQ